jgi:MFS superfamily sulfate permease-like transporter
VLRPTAGDVSGAVADLGIFVPLCAALVLVNGLEVGSVLLGAGLLVLTAGLLFRIPFPVQPLKALSALAVAQGLSPDVIHAAGLEVGLVLLVLTLTGLADRLASVFTHAVIRSLQLGVGALLVISAVNLVRHPPAVFEHTPSPVVGLALAGVALAAVAVAAVKRWYGLTVLLLAVGTCASWLTTRPALGAVELHVPDVGLPPLAVFTTAFVTLVVPQLPLTYGNAVVGVSDLAREHFGDEARRVTPGRVALSCGVGNVASALLGGMPMCHGSSGLSAHIRLGARTAGMNVLLGGVLLTLGLVLSGQVVMLFGLLPVWVLAGFLAYAGLRHALLVLDLHGARLAVAVAAALVGITTGNLAYTTATALLAAHGPRLLGRRSAVSATAQRN